MSNQHLHLHLHLVLLTPDLGLYAGIGPKLLQSTLTAAFMFVTQRRIFELVKRTVVSLQQKRAVARA